MPSRKHAATAAEAERPLTKAEACKVLQVAPSADEELVTQAYWHLARKYRAYAHHDADARRKLDELNRAYVVLNPGRGEAPLARELPPDAADEQPWTADLVVRFRVLLHEIAARWPGRTVEMTVLAATTALLTVLALDAGASPLWTLGGAAVAVITIWAPWRRI